MSNSTSDAPRCIKHPDRKAITTVSHILVCAECDLAYQEEGRKYLPMSARVVYRELLDLDEQRKHTDQRVHQQSDGELLPCPFCGVAPPSDSYYMNQGYKWGGITCGACAVQGPEVRTGYEEWPKWKEAAVAAWNTRVHAPVSDERVAEIRERQDARWKLHKANHPFDTQTVLWDIDKLLALLDKKEDSK